MNSFKLTMRDVLTNNILPYWINNVTDHENGGFYGRIDGYENVHPEADKGAVMNARILWSFAASYRVLKKREYLETARRAKDYIEAHFLDKEYGGLYWSVDYKGNPVDTKKQTYAIGFAIYGFSEYARATGDKEALAMALSLYDDIERHTFDAENNGYVEALTREWAPIADMRLSDKDENGSRTMNTHLHIIEPYTNLYRCMKEMGISPVEHGTEEEQTMWRVGKSAENLLDIFINKLLNKQTYHLDLFFNDKWEGERNVESYGHDIEASWLLHEAALVLGDKKMLQRVEPVVRRVAFAADEGLRKDGAMIYEHWKDTGRQDLQRQWWVECETVIGHINLYQHFHIEEALDIAVRCWSFIQKHLIDEQHGEWYWAMLEDGTVDHDGDKAGFWKCPYHNSRMCLELIERDF